MLSSRPVILAEAIGRNMQQMLMLTSINLHSHLHLHQSILLIVSCGVKLISSSQLYSSSNANVT